MRRINWFFSPPPAQGDTTNFTSLIVPALAKDADLVLWTDQRTSISGHGNGIEVRLYDPDRIPWEELNSTGPTIFNIAADNPCGGPIFEVSRRYPGIVILHDPPLPEGSFGEYQGQGTSPEASPRLPEATEGFRSLLSSLEKARGVIVHRNDLFSILKGRNRWPLCFIGRPPADPSEAARYSRTLLDFVARAARLPWGGTIDYLAGRCAEGMGPWSKTTALATAMAKAGKEIEELCHGYGHLAL